MKVLIWTQYFWPENIHINDVATALHKQGVDVTVLTGKPNYPDGVIYEGYNASGIQTEKYGELELVRIPIIPRGNGSLLGMVFNYLSFIFSGYIFAPFALRNKKFDLIFVYAPSPLLKALPAIYLSWIKKTPLVLWVQDLWPEALVSTGFVRNKLTINVVELLVRFIYRFSDSILIQSEAFRSSVEMRTTKANVIHYFPNSALTTDVKLSDLTYSSLANLIAESFSVVFAGNIGKAQSCETIVEAAKLLRDFKNIKFYLIGSGSMADDIKKIIETYNLDNIVMTGKVSVEEMSLIYKSSSVLLLTLKDEPSLSATIPSKLQSYLAAGKPIIACSNGESASIVVQSCAGLSCPAEDVVLLAESVISIYSKSSEERIEMGENGRNYFEKNFELSQKVNELIKHFDDVIKSY